jgi:hypothetical protein
MSLRADMSLGLETIAMAVSLLLAPSACMAEGASAGDAKVTLNDARRTVGAMLAGQPSLKAGAAARDRDGNVAVELVSAEGIVFGHVLVDRETGAVVDPKTQKILFASRN